MANHRPIELTDAHVLQVDEHSIAVDKEAGWPVHATRDPNRPHLEAAAAAWLRDRGGTVDAATTVVHRLDVGTSGVVLLARTTEARRKLSALFEQREVAKVYEAICVGGPVDDEGTLTHYLAKRREQGRDVMRSVRSGGKVAITRYQVIARCDGLSVMRLEPETGRTHQLRAQTAAEGWPILGDRLYGAPVVTAAPALPRSGHQVLHARRLSYTDPFDGGHRVIEAEPPPLFARLVSGWSPS